MIKYHTILNMKLDAPGDRIQILLNQKCFDVHLTSEISRNSSGLHGQGNQTNCNFSTAHSIYVDTFQRGPCDFFTGSEDNIDLGHRPSPLCRLPLWDSPPATTTLW